MYMKHPRTWCQKNLAQIGQFNKNCRTIDEDKIINSFKRALLNFITSSDPSSSSSSLKTYDDEVMMKFDKTHFKLFLCRHYWSPVFLNRPILWKLLQLRVGPPNASLYGSLEQNYFCRPSSVLVLSVAQSLRFNGHFPGEPGLAGV